MLTTHQSPPEIDAISLLVLADLGTVLTGRLRRSHARLATLLHSCNCPVVEDKSLPRPVRALVDAGLITATPKWIELTDAGDAVRRALVGHLRAATPASN